MGQEDDGLRKKLLLIGIVCVCVALLLVTPCLAAQPRMVKIDAVKGEYHIGEDLVVSGTTKNLPDGTMIDIGFESPPYSRVPITTYVVDNHYTATVHTDYLGVGKWSVWASTPFEWPSAASRYVSVTILP
ncbi:hypothetical protein F8E02_08025 [Methanoculleus sp. Wushi-C6]|uniref:DUF4198 domain-containing protein n=1 Tax=Methanoculleus caldifontis TaxID=2651577 RepID=A0ABU3X2G2_9EURY|nr:hypothetical protein [Methanoculleus sp. Wushi-C6]MDV2481955.1 hypothetical protein [Methanoculleus sp. Wushi-C6]